MAGMAIASSIMQGVSAGMALLGGIAQSSEDVASNRRRLAHDR
jgi:hypothetical protein